jgi:hypothetical protein
VKIGLCGNLEDIPHLDTSWHTPFSNPGSARALSQTAGRNDLYNLAPAATPSVLRLPMQGENYQNLCFLN